MSSDSFIFDISRTKTGIDTWKKKMEKKATYLVRDEKRLIVDPSWDAKEIDTQYYKLLLDKAYEEIVRMLPKSSSRSN